ncbi:MAG: BatD family protein, partial [Planctomycetes bacterium]|nr:BatD family protein [Planctomycetota bacterium]
MAARTFRVLFLLALAAAAPRAALAQDAAPALSASLGRTRIYQGESVDFYVEVKNVEDPPAELELPRMEAVTAEFDRRSTNTSNFEMWVNGRKVSQASWTFVYRWVLTPNRAGEIDIPVPELQVGGVALRGGSLRLTVVEPEEQDLVIFDARMERAGEYPLQPFTVVLRIFVKRLPGSHRDDDPLAYLSDAPRLTIPWVDPPDGLAAQSMNDWLSPLLARGGRRLQPCGFSINEVRAPRTGLFDFGAPPLAVFDLGGRPATAGDGAGVERLGGRATDYFVYTLRREFTPMRPGTFVLGGATIKGAIIEDVKGRDAIVRDVFDVGKATVVRVADAPREGRPASFCGAFGQGFALAAGLQPRRARVGDPLTFTLTLSGQGNVHQVDPPDLAADLAFRARFQVEKPTADRERQDPVFTYSLRPLAAGVNEVPPASLSYFDVEEERYVTVSSEAIAIEVEEVASLDGADIVRGENGAGRAPLARAEGLLGNVTDPREVRDDAAD